MAEHKNESIEATMKQLIMRDSPLITMDDAAELLKDNSELLNKFDEIYKASVEKKEESNSPLTNSKKMTELINRTQTGKDGLTPAIDEEKINNIISTIVSDLVAVTPKFEFNGDLNQTDNIKYTNIEVDINDVLDSTTKLDLESIPIEYRPQLTATKVIRDIPGTGVIILSEYKKAIENIGTKEGMLAYHRFRQGLDILDIDDISYIIIAQNRNSMGHWLHKLIEASIGQSYFKIPKTTVVTVPPTLLQLTKLDYSGINQTTRKILNNWTKLVFNLESNNDYFIKTGTYSFKFDFRNVRVKDPKEIDEIGEYLLYIHGYANQCAGPLCSPCIYGMSTTNEWVVRKFIESKENTPTIYNGLPLHVEYRVFIDCDTHEILSIHPYWDPEGMKKHFSKNAKGGNINHIHDYVVFKSYEDKMIKKYNQNKDSIVKNLQPIVNKLNLTGQWSLDIMDDGEQLWLIDMAVAEQSTFYESVPEDKRRPVLESWLPGTKPVMPPWFNKKAIDMATNQLKDS